MILCFPCPNRSPFICLFQAFFPEVIIKYHIIDTWIFFKCIFFLQSKNIFLKIKKKSVKKMKQFIAASNGLLRK